MVRWACRNAPYNSITTTARSWREFRYKSTISQPASLLFLLDDEIVELE